MNAPHVWTTAEDIALLEMARANVPVEERAKRLGVRAHVAKLRLTTLRKRGGADHPGAGTRTTVPREPITDRVPPADVNIPVEFEEPAQERSSREMLEKLAKLTKRGSSLEEACDRMDLSPRRLRELVEEGKRLGFAVDIDGPIVGRRPPTEALEARPVKIDAAGEKRIFAQITDLHFGSRYHLNPQLVDFIDLAYARGVRTMLVTGDMLEGCYPHAQWQLTHHGYEDQANYFAEALPRRDGLTYHAISGNHDETFEDKAGMLVCRSLTETFNAHGRNDLIMHGQRAARLVLKSHERERGLVVELWHPRGSGAYALSYKLQKKIESFGVGRKPDVLFCGHFHQSVYMNTRGIHAFQGGTFQGGGGPFGNSLAGSPCIGGWIVEYAQTEGGTVRRFAPEWVAYYEHEIARDVEVGAA